MQRVASNVEEEMIVKAIQEEATWDKLPKRLKLFLSTNEEWQKRVKEYCIKKRFKWSDCAARNACKENEYYEDLMRYLRKNLALFPYHLAENVCRFQRISPFRYYCEMLYEVMKNERPYDSIPNFSAADALRITGIGRNEFIDIMNKCKAKKLMWKFNKSIAKEMLPNQPVDFPVEPWWAVSVVNLSVEEFRKLSEEEMVVIDKVGKEELNLIAELDLHVVRNLYRRGLVYLEVPVFPDDHFQVSTLDGFVSNRDQSYEDPIEELLYAVFVASSEQATISELAQTLQADLPQLEAAVSMAARLGWAKKVLDPESLLGDNFMPTSPLSEASNGEDSFGFTSPMVSSPFQEGLSEADVDSRLAGSTRFAFMVDANLTGYLMMGSLSPGLKGHAVTLYEAGKLGDTSVAEMCEDLRQVEGTKLEGELQQFADHAFSLRHALECLRSGGTGLTALELRDGEVEFEVSEKTDTDFGDFQLGPSAVPLNIVPSPEIGAGLFTLFEVEDRPKLTRENEKGVESDDKEMPGSLEFYNDVSQMTASPSFSDGMGRGRSRSKKANRRSRVDVIRVESLQGLTPATVQRVLRRDYNVVVSMIPLPSPPSVVSPDGVGPVHFGPPCRAAISPWMKLLLYSVTGSGPVSIALIRGQRLRLLPHPLAGCAKALVWAWDGIGVSGVGGKFEGTLVEGGILLHCLNSMLKHSAVLIQPFPKTYLDNDGKGTVLTKDVPLPLREPSKLDLDFDKADNAESYISLSEAADKLNLRTLGYIRMVQVRKVDDSGLAQTDINDAEWEWIPQSVEFGVPLFDTKLCKMVCEGAIRFELFQHSSLLKHRESMQQLRRNLQDFISDYQANGSIARLAYSGGHVTHSGKSALSISVSSKWSISDGVYDPLMPSATDRPSNAQTPRRRRRSEVVSFDGELPRSYPLPPVYEPATQFIEESSTVSQVFEAKLNFLDEDDGSEIPLPGVNLIFDGSRLMPLNIGIFLQGRLPASLVAEAAIASLQQVY